MKTLCILVLSFFFLHPAALAQRQGIEGEVFWLNGNQMPGPGKTASPKQGIIREIYIYSATTIADTEQNNGFYTAVKSTLIAKTTSDEEGQFKVKLPPGKYSIFTKEPAGLFANLIDKDGLINCVIVKPKKYSWITISIDYEAAY